MAAPYFHVYVTKDGDRWDLIAYRYYGDALRMEPLITSNPNIPLYRILPSGLKILVPVLAEQSTTGVLPPWRQ